MVFQREAAGCPRPRGYLAKVGEDSLSRPSWCATWHTEIGGSDPGLAVQKQLIIAVTTFLSAVVKKPFGRRLVTTRAPRVVGEKKRSSCRLLVATTTVHRKIDGPDRDLR